MKKLPFALITLGFACLALLLGFLWARNEFFTESKLIGEWHYSYREDYFPQYTSDLTINPDKTFRKIETYLETADAQPITAIFEGPYVVNGNGFEPGLIMFAINGATAKLDGDIVANSSTGGYSAFCNFGFGEQGRLLISEPVDSTSGHSKDPRLRPKWLLPSWEHYSKAK